MEGTKDISKGLAALRVILGIGFLYAGLEKVLDFGHTGAFTAAGYLGHATGGSLPYMADPKAIVNPTHDFWVSLASNAAAVSTINVLVQFGELAIGVALVLGLATRFAGVMAALMMALFYVASWNFSLGPISEQFIYGAVALFLAYARAGDAYGLDALIEKTTFVKRSPAVAAFLH